jgi:hypothetical protein
MIKNEPCCDDCLDGEPCCDEELAEHIEEQLAEHLVTAGTSTTQFTIEQQTDIITVGVTVDIEQLARHLCCQTRFHHIYNAMDGLSKEQLIELRDQLRSYTPTNSLHPHLNAVFSKAIGE